MRTISILAIWVVVNLLPLAARQAPPADMFQLAILSEDKAAQPTVINARRVTPKLYSASFYAKDLKCSSSLVGPKTFLTAAHCLKKGPTMTVGVGTRIVVTTCTTASAYPKNLTADYALCLAPDDINDTPYFESVSLDATKLKINQEVSLTGFGCTERGGGGDKTGNVYRVGEAPIQSLPNGSDNFLVTRGETAVCFGDSGGPAFLQMGKDGSPRFQVSVNGVGDNNRVSGLASLSTTTAISFLQDWSTRHGQKICGLHPDATKCQPQVVK